jgi:hypothetical protein
MKMLTLKIGVMQPQLRNVSSHQKLKEAGNGFSRRF